MVRGCIEKKKVEWDVTGPKRDITVIGFDAMHVPEIVTSGTDPFSAFVRG